MRIAALARARPVAFADQPLRRGRLMVRAYQPGDEYWLTLRDDFLAQWDAAGHQLPPGLRWTLTRQDARGSFWPVAIGGLEKLSGPGCWGAWGLASDLAPRDWAFVRGAAGKFMAHIEREFGARQIHAMALPTPGAIALLAGLGFERGDLSEAPDGATYLHMIRSF